MEKNEVSIHLLKVFEFVKKSSGWVTSADIAKGSGVAPRTARSHALLLVQMGIFDQAEVFPAHRYRFSDKAEKRNKSYMIRIQNAKEVFGK